MLAGAAREVAGNPGQLQQQECMGTVGAIAAAVTAVAGLLALILRWYFGSGREVYRWKQELRRIESEIKELQKRRSIALFDGDMGSVNMLCDEIGRLCEARDELRRRLSQN